MANAYILTQGTVVVAAFASAIRAFDQASALLSEDASSEDDAVHSLLADGDIIERDNVDGSLTLIDGTIVSAEDVKRLFRRNPGSSVTFEGDKNVSITYHNIS
jgi:hypothetical protein|tara:strand:+ start:228 stop:536 length:309 start_codon:yes stop_codon:yes gene_type:complete